MPEALTAIGVAFAAKGAVDANRARKRAKAYNAIQQFASREELNLAREQYKRYREKYLPYEVESLKDAEKYRKQDRKFYEEKYRPIERGLVQDVSRDDRTKFSEGLATFGVDQDYVRPREDVALGLQSRQIAPDSGAYKNRLTSLDIAQASDRAGQLGLANLKEQERQFNNQMQALGRGDAALNTPVNVRTGLNAALPGQMYNLASRIAGTGGRAQLAYSNQLAQNLGNMTKNLTSLYQNYAAGAATGVGGSLGFAHGGEVNMQSGDYVLPADVVDKVSEKFLDNIVERVTGKEPKGYKV